MEGEEFLNTSWVNYFSAQSLEIGGLSPNLYEFKTVGKNKLGESPPSDVTEARPLPELKTSPRVPTSGSASK